jgi:phospholipid/cholesterol/gamma-HCH transport system substrate-binding protein
MKVETKVGLLFLMAIVFVVIFASMMGMMNPFSASNELVVLYNYAGGIDKGSPIRVMGIEVGKVKSIEFDPNGKTATGEEVKLKIKISINKTAWQTVKQDSRFYINMAGVIGEKFLEISPGSSKSPGFTSGDLVRGEDPPRIDQMISQGYGLAGKILDIVSKNEGSVTGMITQIDQLITNFNKTLALLDRTSKNKDISKLVNNFITLTDDLVYITGKLRSEKSEHAFDTVLKLINRMEDLDGPAIRKFLQQEGIKARLL